MLLAPVMSGRTMLAEITTFAPRKSNPGQRPMLPLQCQNCSADALPNRERLEPTPNRAKVDVTPCECRDGHQLPSIQPKQAFNQNQF